MRAHQKRGEEQPVLDVEERQRDGLGCADLQAMGEGEQPCSDVVISARTDLDLTYPGSGLT